MEKRTDSPYPRRDRPVLAIIGLVLVASTAFFAWSDRQHDYKYYQYEFTRLVADKFGDEQAGAVRTGLQQIWVADLGRADRCVTCHQATSWKGLEGAEQPWRTHPVEPLKLHAVERYGCTACHGGQGWAIDTDEAHGEVAHWEEPLLGSYLGEEYSLVEDKAALMQMNCNVCHRFDRETAGAPMINHAKVLVQQKGCRACHIVNARGGTIGPDLTYVGDKAPEQYEYGRLSGQKTAFAWHVAHFKDPRALVQDTVMPNFHFSTKDAQALSMLVLSWRKVDLPAAYYPGAPRTDPQTAGEREAEERMMTGPGGWFVKTGCFVCHSISVYGVKSPAQIGPDLSIAAADVQSRFGRTLDDFFMNPTGTMSVVLSRQIILNTEQRREAISRMREAYAEYERLKASGQDPLAVSH
ncbi:MAG TPA: c-type cytochrome [Vicinamibacterales bacterium]|nr:c-type cytochrome [Vicinamibacterales bacterium]